MDKTKHKAYFRFFDKEKNKMDNNIYIFPNEASLENWKKWISVCSYHYMQLPYRNDVVGTIDKKRYYNDAVRSEINYNQMREYIRNTFKNYKENAEVIVFWQAKSSIRTSFSFFLKKIEKFCRPSEEGSIIILPDEEVGLIYTMGILYVVEREIFFYTKVDMD